MTFDSITGIIGIIGAAVAIYFSLRIKPKEIRKFDGDIGAEGIDSIADALKIARDAASQVADMSTELGKEKTKNRYELDGLRAEIDEMKFELDTATAQLEVIKDWAERLSHQVISLGGVPVKCKEARKVIRDSDIIRGKGE